MADSFVKSRRGILEHLETNRFTVTEFAVFQLLLLLADKAFGVVWIKAPSLADKFRDGNVKTIQRALHGLKEKGYIKSFQEQGSRGKYPVIINKYEVTVGGLKGGLIDAAATTDWRTPVINARTEVSIDGSTEVGSEVSTPYSRPTRASRPQDLQDRQEGDGGTDSVDETETGITINLDEVVLE